MRRNPTTREHERHRPELRKVCEKIMGAPKDTETSCRVLVDLLSDEVERVRKMVRQHIEKGK